jgi:multidrug efflux pump subunit AcrA (membrane-fusion protein)
LKRKDKLIAAVVAAALIVVGIYYMVRGGSVEPTAPAPEGEAVRVQAVVAGPVQEEISLTGEVRALADVALAPKVSGRLMSLEVEQGDYVAAGTVVAALDSDTFEAAVRQAEAPRPRPGGQALRTGHVRRIKPRRRGSGLQQGACRR